MNEDQNMQGAPAGSAEGTQHDNEVAPQSTEGTNVDAQQETQPQQPSSFQEETGQVQDPEALKKAGIEIGQRTMAREKDAIIAQKDAEIAALKQQSQPQESQPQPQEPQQNEDLSKQVSDLRYMQERTTRVDSHISQNVSDARLRADVMQLASQDAYKNLPTNDLFDLARTRNPEPPEPNQPQPMGQQTAPGRTIPQDENGGSLAQRTGVADAEEAAGVKRAKELGLLPQNQSFPSNIREQIDTERRVQAQEKGMPVDNIKK